MERHGIVSRAFTCVDVHNFNWIAALTNNVDWVQAVRGYYSRKVSNLQIFLLSIHNFAALLLSVIYLLRDATKRRDDIWISPGFYVKIFRIYFVSIFCVDHQKVSVEESFKINFTEAMETSPIFLSVFIVPRRATLHNFSCFPLSLRHLVALLTNLLLVDTTERITPEHSSWQEGEAPIAVLISIDGTSFVATVK